MAHYNIFQVSKQPLEEDDYINASDMGDNMCMEGQYKEFADYIDDPLDEEGIRDAMKICKDLLKGMFDFNGRELTFRGADNFIAEWISKMKEQLEKVEPKESLSFWDLQKMTTQTHYRTWHRFVWSEAVEYGTNDNYPEELGDFALTCYKHLNPGDKLYIGGVVSFKF